MLAVLSPAKSLDYESPLATRKYTRPRLLEDAADLVDVMRTKSVHEVASMMQVSEELAATNVRRYQDFTLPFTYRNARAAVLAFDGEVYRGLDAPARFDARDFTEAQKTVRILSGLYGILRPLDLIQPYRLEMGVTLPTERGATLYQWWDTRLTDLLVEDLHASPGPAVLLNLASQEYSKALQFSRFNRVISPRFEQATAGGGTRLASFAAKRARGLMTRWVVQQRVRSVRALQRFDLEGYRFDPARSTADTPVFVREQDAPAGG
ncbi:MAG: peroxide stress protein YaaA [Micrococcales bacterium]|nr:MAG: peroxide stress protein YaaA [Micrococcales bacterium]